MIRWFLRHVRAVCWLAAGSAITFALGAVSFCLLASFIGLGMFLSMIPPLLLVAIVATLSCLSSLLLAFGPTALSCFSKAAAATRPETPFARVIRR